MDYSGDNIVDNYTRSVDKSLLEFVEFKISVQAIHVYNTGQATFGKLAKNLQRGSKVGYINIWQDSYSDVWVATGKLPKWIVMELEALARGELAKYYRQVRNRRNHPTNAYNSRRPN